MRTARVVPVACLATLLSLAGCSDSKDKSASQPTTASTKAAGTPTTVRPVGTSFTGVGSAEFCQFMATFTAGQQSVGLGASPADLQASFTEALDAIHQAETAAPAEIKGDVSAISDSFEKVVTAVSDADYNIAGVDPAALDALQSPAFLNAVTRMQAYLSSVCKTG